MKTVILVGGYGTRLSEETDLRPKPMLEIGGKPILWHIMKLYSHHGFNEFVILLGYRGYVVKEYFANYFLHQNDVTFDLAKNEMEVHSNTGEPWKVTLLDTGLDTMTGGRILRAKKYIGDEPFMLTYGDGVSNVDLAALLKIHNSHEGVVTVTTIQPEGRFGSVDSTTEGRIDNFTEKPKGDGAWINGGFFVCSPDIFNYLSEGDNTVLERAPLENLAADGKLYSYQHHGFWKCMDTLRDKVLLNDLWRQNNAGWKVW